MHAYASSHQLFVELFIQHLLLSCWPLLLIRGNGMVSGQWRESGMEQHPPAGTKTIGEKKRCACRFLNSSFDV
jgi:hypothetical protein